MSYKGSSKGSYGGRHIYGRTVAGVQHNRSLRAKILDSELKAPIAKNEDQWMNDPSHYDLPGIDTIEVISPKNYLTLDKVLESQKAKELVNHLFGGQPVIFKPKKEKIKIEHKTKEDTKLTYLERAHLLALTKKYGIDRAEIDHKLSYDENKNYLEHMAKENSYSKENLKRADLEAKEWAGDYKDFIDNVSEDSEKWRDYF